jgi:hypothetical protein
MPINMADLPYNVYPIMVDLATFPLSSISAGMIGLYVSST